MSRTLILAGIALWFTLGSLLSWHARRNLGKGMIEYFLADRKVGGFISAMTYSATTYSAFMMVGLVGLTYSSGIGSLGFEMTGTAASGLWPRRGVTSTGRRNPGGYSPSATAWKRSPTNSTP